MSPYTHKDTDFSVNKFNFSKSPPTNLDVKVYLKFKCQFKCSSRSHHLLLLLNLIVTIWHLLSTFSFSLVSWPSKCATSCAIRTLLLSSQEFDQQIQNTQDVIMFLVQVASPVPDWRGQTSGLGAGPSRAKLPPPGLAAPPGFQNSSAAQHLPPNNLGKIP